MIEIQQVSKRFDEAQALVGISLHVDRGGALALVGPSGSGKTTLLRLICGLEEPDAGEIMIDGRVVSRPGFLTPPWERGIGAVFQKPALWPHLTVRQNIAFGLAGWPRQQAEARIYEILQAMQLGNLVKRYPHQLSSGEAQRTSLGRALAPKPSILLLDEPFSNLDPDLRAVMLRLVQQIRAEEPVTLILVAHNLETASICETRVTLQAGQMVKVNSEPPGG